MRPFCPHCGRKFDDGLLPALRGLLRAPARQRHQAAPPPPGILQDRRGREQDGKKALPPVPAKVLPVKVLPVLVAVIGGGMIGYMLPGRPWLMGAIIGLFIGLPKKKKS